MRRMIDPKTQLRFLVKFLADHEAESIIDSIREWHPEIFATS